MQQDIMNKWKEYFGELLKHEETNQEQREYARIKGN